MKISKAVLAGLASLDEAAAMTMTPPTTTMPTTPPAPQSFLEAC